MLFYPSNRTTSRNYERVESPELPYDTNSVMIEREIWGLYQGLAVYVCRASGAAA